MQGGGGGGEVFEKVDWMSRPKSQQAAFWMEAWKEGGGKEALFFVHIIHVSDSVHVMDKDFSLYSWVRSYKLF